MSERPPITADLRRHMVTDETCSMERLVGYLRIDEVAFVNLCDAIDAVHRGLEQENERLRRERDSALAELDRVLGEGDVPHRAGQTREADGPMGPPRRGTREEGAGMMESIEKLREVVRKVAEEHAHITDAHMKSLIDTIERELAERYTELLEDDSGKVWRIGDMAQSKNFPSAKPKKVCGTGVINGQPVLFYASDNNGHSLEEHKGWDWAHHMRHYRPDSWERIIEDALSAKWSSRGEQSAEFDALVARCKALCERTNGCDADNYDTLMQANARAYELGIEVGQ